MKIWWRRVGARPVAALFAALALNFVSGFPVVAGAQTNSATLSGIVMDGQGAVVPDVAITVSSTATGLKRQVTTNSEGLFTLPLLPPGTYSLQAQREGFSVVEIDGIELPVAGQVSRDIILQVGGVRETVNVSAAPPLLQAETSALAEVVSNRQVDLLPINGRDFRRLTILLPGAAPRSQRGSLGSFTVNGQREKANIFLIDGVDNNDSFRNQPSFNQGGVTGAPATLLPVDAVGEFSLQTQGAAEYGRNSGAIVNIVLKNGTNDFHGAAYEFLRNDNFDARNFFEGAKNEFRNNNFGGVLGGPIIKNRTFFFGGYEGQREFVFSPSLVRVPDAASLAAARTANAGAGLQENALSTRLLQFFPQSNLNTATGNNYSFATPNTNNSDNLLAKIEHRFNDSYSLSGRYIFGDGSQVYFLAGRVAPAGTAVLRGATRRDTFTNNFGLFVQDDWKITTRLTLNLGLRYEYLGVFREQGDRLSNFLPARGLVPVGAVGLDRLYEPDYNNFAPRFGFAYDLTGRGRTILRGAYGLYYDTPSQDYFLLQGFQNGGPGSPALNPLPGLGVFNLTFPAGATIPYGPDVAIFGAASGSLLTMNIPVFAVDPDLRTPYVHNYNLNLQHELRPGTVLQASYVGSHGVKLYRVRDLNQATAGPAATRQQRRPFNAQFREFSFINYLETSANSSYNALQATVKQRLARGFNLYGTYTWSKSLDDASNGIYSGTRGVSYPQDGYDLRAERAVSSFDLRHRVTVNATYELSFLPGLLGWWPKRLAEGWQLSGIYTGQSGLPITPFLSVDSSGTGELND